MKCGKCQQTGPDIDLAHVRACYAAELVGAGAQRAGGNGDQWRMGDDGSTRPIRDAASGTTADDMWKRQAAQREAEQERQAYVGKMRRDYGGQRLGVNRPDTDWTMVNTLRRSIKDRLFERNGRLEGSFAIRVDGVVKFYEIKSPLKGKWVGKVFVSACASDDRHPIKNPETLVLVLRAILADVEGARKLYASELGHCYVCHKELTDELSRELGIGPVCAGKYL